MCDKSAIVVDNGSFTVKAGLAGHEDGPLVSVPTIVGRSRPLKFKQKLTERAVFDSSIEYDNCADRVIRHPMHHGIITPQWENMEAIWDHAFRAIKIEPSERNILMSESPVNYRFKRRKLTEVMFEKYGVKGLYVASTANLALFGVDRFTGVVVDSGEGTTYITPIYEGHVLRRHIKHMNVGGETLTEYMKRKLAHRGLTFQGFEGMATVRDIKESTCFVSTDLKETQTRADCSVYIEKNYKLPSGKTIIVDDERFRVPEALFNSGEVTLRNMHLGTLIHDCIESLDLVLHKDMYANIVLAGGNTMFPGLTERLEHEVSVLAPPRANVKITAVEDRVNLAWQGGSKLARSETFDGFWVSREEYLESGIGGVHQRVF